MFKFPLIKLVEFVALLNVLVLCIASSYQYSFYSGLGLRWGMSLLSISSVLFNAIPLFANIFLGCSSAYFLYYYQERLFNRRPNSFALLGMVLLVYILTIVSSAFFRDKSVNFLVIETLPWLFSFFILSCYYRLFSDAEQNKKIYLICLVTLLVFAIPTILILGGVKAQKLLEGHNSFSQVSLVSDSSIPTSYLINVDNKEIEQKIDWRVVEVINEKVIIIGLNSAAMNGGTKNQIRIVDYKDIEAFH